MMYLRLPWILSRRRLLVAVFLDIFLSVTLSSSLYRSSFVASPEASALFFVLCITWLIISYVVGRYQGLNFTGPYGVSVLQGLFQTIFVLALSLLGSFLCIWLFKVNTGDLFYQAFLIPLLVYFGALSFLVQLLLALWLRSRQSYANEWKYLGNLNTFKRLKYHLKWSRLPAKLDLCSIEELQNSSNRCLIVDDIISQPTSVLKQLLKLQHKGCKILSKHEWCESILQRFPSEFLTEADLLRGDFLPSQGTFQTRLKRLGDLLLALLLLVLTSPIFFIACILIKIEDGGPVFYKQTRSGLEGKFFTIFKLRSMRVDAENNGAQWVKQADTRITNIGYILRRTRIDELPQLWCVFIGSMSLIGPRPERPEFDQKLTSKIPHYGLRNLMRPGLSGWAQVNYPYGASVNDAANKLSYDLYYMRNFSFWLDLLILFKTIKLVFRAQGSDPQH